MRYGRLSKLEKEESYILVDKNDKIICSEFEMTPGIEGPDYFSQEITLKISIMRKKVI